MFYKLICVLGLMILVGCTDGVLYQMKKANPYYRTQWQRDREYGTTFVERMDEINLLNSRLPTMPPEEQMAWATKLEQVIATDPSPEFRARAIQTIAKIPGEATIRALNAASTDESEKVRMVACKAWKEQNGPASRDMLLTLASNPNETTSVRQAAIDCLAIYADDPEVRSAFASLLDDRSPAVQYQTTRSLAKGNVKDLGGDLQAWKDYLNGHEVQNPETSFASGILKSVRFWQ